MGSIWGENDRRPAKWKHSRAQWPIHWKKCPNSPSSSTACGDAFFTLTLRPIRLKFVTHNHRYMGSIRGENERGPAKWKRSRAQWPIHWKKCPNSPSSSTACGDAFFTLTLRPIPLTFVTRNDRHMCSISGENDPYPPEWPWLPSDEKMETLEKRMYKKNFVRRYNCIVQSTTIKVHDLMVLADTEGRYHIRYGVCVYTSLK